MVEERHTVLARNAKRCSHLCHQQSRDTLQQRCQPPLGIFDRVLMKEDFLALGTVKCANYYALAQQTVDRAL